MKKQPKFIKQTKTGKGEGNCLAACIASLLGCDIDIVPDYKEEWYEKLNIWMLRKLGHVMISVDFLHNDMPNILLIAIGESSLFTGQKHAVIYRGSKQIFDPSPSNLGLKGKPECYIVLAKDFQYKF